MDTDPFSPPRSVIIRGVVSTTYVHNGGTGDGGGGGDDGGGGNGKTNTVTKSVAELLALLQLTT